MKIKTSELQGVALDWAVARCELGEAINEVDDPHFYSTDWALAGPIIERENILIGLCYEGEDWIATRIKPPAASEARGPTMLIAAMRCYVASQLGDEVEVPSDLM